MGYDIAKVFFQASFGLRQGHAISICKLADDIPCTWLCMGRVRQRCQRVGLDSCMIPTMLNGGWLDSIPGLLYYDHGFLKAYFIDITITSFVKFNSMETECSMVVSLEAMNDSSIERLNK